MTRAKASSSINSMLACRHLRRFGKIMLDTEGYVAEGSEGLFLVRSDSP
jgi:hypothetical protein